MRRGRVPNPLGQQRKMTNRKVWARSRMQVEERLGGVIRKYLGGLWSSAVLEDHPS